MACSNWTVYETTKLIKALLGMRCTADSLWSSLIRKLHFTIDNFSKVSFIISEPSISLLLLSIHASFFFAVMGSATTHQRKKTHKLHQKPNPLLNLLMSLAGWSKAYRRWQDFLGPALAGGWAAGFPCWEHAVGDKNHSVCNGMQTAVLGHCFLATAAQVVFLQRLWAFK